MAVRTIIAGVVRYPQTLLYRGIMRYPETLLYLAPAQAWRGLRDTQAAPINLVNRHLFSFLVVAAGFTPLLTNYSKRGCALVTSSSYPRSPMYKK